MCLNSIILYLVSMKNLNSDKIFSLPFRWVNMSNFKWLNIVEKRVQGGLNTVTLTFGQFLYCRLSKTNIDKYVDNFHCKCYRTIGHTSDCPLIQEPDVNASGDSYSLSHVACRTVTSITQWPAELSDQRNSVTLAVHNISGSTSGGTKYPTNNNNSIAHKGVFPLVLATTGVRGALCVRSPGLRAAGCGLRVCVAPAGVSPSAVYPGTGRYQVLQQEGLLQGGSRAAVRGSRKSARRGASIFRECP